KPIEAAKNCLRKRGEYNALPAILQNVPENAKKVNTLKASGSFVKPEVNEVVVVHDVRLDFQALLSGALGLSPPARLDKVREADDLGPDKPFLDVRVNRAGGLPRGRAR